MRGSVRDVLMDMKRVKQTKQIKQGMILITQVSPIFQSLHALNVVMRAYFHCCAEETLNSFAYFLPENQYFCLVIGV